MDRSDSLSKEISRGEFEGRINKLKTAAAAATDATVTATADADQNLSPQERFGFWRGSAYVLVRKKYFNWTIQVCITASAFQMGCQADLPHRAGFESLDWVWPASEAFLTLIFFGEMILKVFADQWEYFHDQWNWLDFAVSWAGMFSLAIVPIIQMGAPDFADIDIAKIFRLARLIRLAQVFKAIPELMMVLEGLVASMKSMVYVFMLLFIVTYTIAIYCVELIGREDSCEYYHFNSNRTELREDSRFYSYFNNYEYFGNVPRALLTLFSMVLVAEWSQIVRPVYEEQTEHVPAFILMILITSFGIVNVIIGVIVEKTNESMKRMDQLRADEVREEQNEMITELSRIMYEADTSGDGKLTADELVSGHTGLQEKLEVINLPRGFQLEDLFTMLDVDGSGLLSQQEFVEGMQRLIMGDEFQRSCTEQLTIGQIKSTVHSVSQDIKAITAQVKSICQEISTPAHMATPQSERDVSDARPPVDCAPEAMLSWGDTLPPAAPPPMPPLNSAHPPLNALEMVPPSHPAGVDLMSNTLETREIMQGASDTYHDFVAVEEEVPDEEPDDADQPLSEALSVEMARSAELQWHELRQERERIEEARRQMRREREDSQRATEEALAQRRRAEEQSSRLDDERAQVVAAWHRLHGQHLQTEAEGQLVQHPPAGRRPAAAGGGNADGVGPSAAPLRQRAAPSASRDAAPRNAPVGRTDVNARARSAPPPAVAADIKVHTI